MADEKKCESCGCTEDRACQISVFTEGPEGGNLVAERPCSWSVQNPSRCTACVLADEIDGDDQADRLEALLGCL